MAGRCGWKAWVSSRCCSAAGWSCAILRSLPWRAGPRSGRPPRPAPVSPFQNCGAAPASSGLEQASLLAARGLEADGRIALLGQDPPLRGALQVAFLDEERLVDLLQGLGLLAD